VKKMFYLLIVATATPLLGGCFGKGSSADPPSNFMATAGDGRVTLTWDPVPNVDFWIFTATDPSLTAFNWTGLPNAQAYINAAKPFYMCGLYNGTKYYFAANGRTNGGPGGTSSPTITPTNHPPDNAPYNASAEAWASGSTTPPATSNFLGVGYTSRTTCSNPPYTAISAAGSFAAVGASGTIFTSPDGITWTNQTTPSGFTSNLNAVTGYAANLNNLTTPNLRWVAVGDGGASVYSTDGITWTAASTAAANPSNYTLHSITHNAGTYTAVGDAGTILSTTDGITWTSHTSPTVTSNNLNGVTHGSIYVAVGDSGTILTSADGNTWAAHASSPTTSSNLHQVAAYGGLYVAVGDAGTILTSKDNGVTWYTQTLGTASLVAAAAETLVYDPANTVANKDAWLTVVPSAQFVVVDVNGDAYASVIGSDPNANGLTWSGSTSTGVTNTHALVSSGFGYVAAGNAGAISYAF
jgi:photosystem II stability/assembly factor-like uncharacterized protein